MNNTTRQTFVACISTLLLFPLAGLRASDAPEKSLPLAGEGFLVEGHADFLTPPEAKPASRPITWVWYAPPLPGLPGNAEKWMFERLTGAGIAIAGVDVGESNGSPDGRAVLDVVCAQAHRPTSQPPKGESTNAVRAGGRKAAAEKKLDEKYRALVASLSPDQQTWERLLQQNLGSFYLPIHKRQKLAGKSNAWDFVQDDLQLPRVLLIGDSVSRGYTLAARKALAGKANVHRAPANCGSTATGLKRIDVWLGDGQWEVIHFNFGIHDRFTPVANYTQRLEKLVERMQKTGAKLIWASTTPIPNVPSKKQTAASIVERNQAAAAIMGMHSIAIDDLFTAITPHLNRLQNANDVHFNADGYEFLGERVAESIEASMN